MDYVEQGDFDAIVVGTGPGGATVARDLAKRSKKVLILERGLGGPVRGDFWQGLTELLMPGRGLLVTPDLVGLVRGISLGGSSTFYYATAFPVPVAMFQRHGVDLARDVAEAQAELPVAPLKDEMMTPMASRIMRAAQTLGLPWKRLDKLMYQDRWRPGRPFGHYGDPTGVKWTARAYVEEAVAHGAVLLTDARVRKVLHEGGKATGVEYELHGRRQVASAGKVVVAAGGVASPVILRRSGIREAGFDFFFDPLITVCGTLKDVRTRVDEIPMAGGLLLEDEGYLLADMHVPRAMHFILTLAVFKLSKLLSFRHTARIMVKVKDSLGGRVTNGERVRKKLAAEDKAKLQRGIEQAKRILAEAGATDIYQTWYLAAHPGGSVKLGQLVDASLQTSIANLHVCDGSVIPEPWGMPPTLALIGLGRYLARHLTSG
jgi:choline dehydrogenase-like flavoprotein